MRTLVRTMAAAALAICVVGCGDAKYASPKATMESMLAAGKAGDKDAMFACFSEGTRAKFDEMEKLFADLKAERPELAEKAKMGDVSQKMMEKAKDATMEYGEEKIDGDKATLEVTTDGDKETLQFVREGGGWKIDLPISDAQMGQMKKGIEMMKKMPKGMMKGLKGLGDKMKKENK